MKKQWWHEKIAYQIYPKSFRDSNGDGIGDIRGIIEKLDYIDRLGVDILWISPMYQSPMVDNGYDISDYYTIDPMFGTMKDMEELLVEAKKRNISILMDLVVNHCSNEHKWFKEAMKDPNGKYGKYFYIKDGNNGNPPNNWRSYFGGSVWEKVPGCENKFYYHSFAKEQPDLNWENPEVREEIYQMICWWMEKGLGGFRIDAIMNIKKDLTWKDLPVDGADGMGAVHKTIERAAGIEEFLLEMKHRCFEPYDGLAIGEAMYLTEEEVKKYIGDRGYFSSIFAFEPCHVHRKGEMYGEYQWPMSFKEWRKETFHNQKMLGDTGFEANIIENHDQPRGASLFIPEEDYGFYSVTALAVIMICQRGLPFLYQGQEIGMVNRDWELDEFDDLETKNQYCFMVKSGFSKDDAIEACIHHSRDNARTPMQWQDKENAGFTDGRPWLPVNENYRDINVEKQECEYGSILNFYRRLIAFRKSEKYKEILTYGTFEPMYKDTGTVFAYKRELQGRKLAVICNYSSQIAEVELEENYENVIFVNYEQTTMVRSKLQMKPYEVIVLE